MFNAGSRRGAGRYGRQTWVRPALALPPAASDHPDAEATTILPRTSSGSLTTVDWQDSIDDFSDIDDGAAGVLGRRTKLALLIAGVAAVCVVGLAIGWASWDRRTLTTSPSTGCWPTSAPSGGPTRGTAERRLDAQRQGREAGQLRSDLEGRLDPARYDRRLGPSPPAGWRAGRGPADVGLNDPAAAQRQRQEAARHPARGDAFTSPEEAGQAFAVAAKTLGGCAEGGYVQSGWSVRGLGDQAVGLVVVIERDGKDRAPQRRAEPTGR